MIAPRWSTQLAVVLTATWVTVAAADPSHRELGAAHYAKGNYAAAAAEFRLCIATEQRADCSFALAQALRVLGDCPGAVRSYKDFLATAPGPAEARAAREAISACGGTYEPPPPKLPPAEVKAPVSSPQPRHSEQAPWYRDRVAVAAFVVGGVATAAGATSLWLAGRAHDDAGRLGDGTGTLAEFEARLDDADRYRWIGGVALGIGGALLITAVVKLAVRDEGATTASVFASGDGVLVTAGRPF